MEQNGLVFCYMLYIIYYSTNSAYYHVSLYYDYFYGYIFYKFNNVLSQLFLNS
jgi:hypothetical protein